MRGLSWRPPLFGGEDGYPAWFEHEFVRLFRPPLSRTLKKANRQLRDTKTHFDISSETGVLILVNDGFTAISPEFVIALASDLLVNSYSSISCCIYLTVNRYIEVLESDEPKLLWAPVYAETAPESLVDFVNNLGRRWFDFLEMKIGLFTSRSEISSGADILRGSKSIRLPYEDCG